MGRNDDHAKLFGRNQAARHPDPRNPHTQAAMRLEAIQALESGRIAPLDRFGAKIQKGALVVYNSPQPLVFEVVDVDPLGNDPQGNVILKLQMAAVVNPMLPANIPSAAFIVCGKTSADGQHGELGVARTANVGDATNEDQTQAPPAGTTNKPGGESGGENNHGGGDGGPGAAE